MKRLTVICISFIVVSLMFVGMSDARIDLELCVGMWLFDEEKVDTVKDMSGQGNDGIVANPPQWIDGKFGKAVDFASGQSIEVPDADSLNFGLDDSFSVVVWFNFKTAQDWNRLVRERNPGPWGNGSDGWELQTQGTQIHWSLDDKAGHHKKTTYDNAGNGEWRHTTMIVDRDEKMLITYLDGVDKKSVDIADIEAITGILPVIIGDGVVGAIDDMGIFNVILSEDDIQTIMNQGLEKSVVAAVSLSGKLTTTWGMLKR